MLTLAIDTSEQYCSACLFDDKLLAVQSDNIGRGHAEHLLPMLDDLLHKAGKTYENLQRIIVCTGPGSFTGLRVGLSAARGLALALDIPCVGVSGLHVYASQAKASDGDLIHVVMKGRGSTLFYQSFMQTSGGLVKALTKPENIEVNKAQANIDSNIGAVIGSGLLQMDIETSSYNTIIDCQALALLGQTLDPVISPPEPHYLREADAVKKPALFPIAHALNPNSPST